MNKLLIPEIYTADFDYNLPDDRIPKFPLTARDSSKLLIYKDKKIDEGVFVNLTQYLPKGSLLVFNNTKVIKARLLFKKPTGAQIEVFCLEPYLPALAEESFSSTTNCTWKCTVGNLKKWKDSALQQQLVINGKEILLTAYKKEVIDDYLIIEFRWDKGVSFAEVLDAFGAIPIPPYLKRDAVEEDNERYQTVYSSQKGSVAAPTAGLHFTPQVIDSLHKSGIETDELTLHVGAGTFKPVKSDTALGHSMHTEHFSVTLDNLNKLINKQQNIIAVGTTSVRTLESLYWLGCKLNGNKNVLLSQLVIEQWEPYIDNSKQGDLTLNDALSEIINFMKHNHLNKLNASTQIMILPGYKFKVIKGMVTNFHQPKSTLLMLIAAFLGNDWKNIYQYALNHDFRFLSYGDSSLLLP